MRSFNRHHKKAPGNAGGFFYLAAVRHSIVRRRRLFRLAGDLRAATFAQLGDNGIELQAQFLLLFLLRRQLQAELLYGVILKGDPGFKIFDPRNEFFIHDDLVWRLVADVNAWLRMIACCRIWRQHSGVKTRKWVSLLGSYRSGRYLAHYFFIIAERSLLFGPTERLV